MDFRHGVWELCSLLRGWLWGLGVGELLEILNEVNEALM